MKTAELIEQYQRTHGTGRAEELYAAVKTLSEMGLVSKQQAETLKETRYHIAREKIEREARRAADRIKNAARDYASGKTAPEEFLYTVKTFFLVYDDTRSREFNNAGF